MWLLWEVGILGYFGSFKYFLVLSSWFSLFLVISGISSWDPNPTITFTIHESCLRKLKRIKISFPRWKPLWQVARCWSPADVQNPPSVKLDFWCPDIRFSTFYNLLRNNTTSFPSQTFHPKKTVFILICPSGPSNFYVRWMIWSMLV